VLIPPLLGYAGRAPAAPRAAPRSMPATARMGKFVEKAL
jgi:hypothetical protein